MGAKRDGSLKEPNNSAAPTRQDTLASKVKPEAAATTTITTTTCTTKPFSTANAEVTRPLAPPPRPPQAQAPSSRQDHDATAIVAAGAAGAAATTASSSSSESPGYFASQIGSGPGAAGSLSLEPNPFEQSFSNPSNPSNPPAETPGGTKLPSVASMTSPASLIPGAGTTPFPWVGSLRTGPLSPAMLSGPTGDYFSDTHHMRGGFPTPNESSMRTGLTPGGSGSMFPAQSPNTQALFGLAGSVSTPSTVEFHRTALNAAAAAKRDGPGHAQPPQSVVTTQAHEPPNGNTTTLPTSSRPEPKPKPPTGSYDPHDNDAANGLFMLAQGRNGAAQPPPQASHYPAPPLPPNHAHAPPPAAAVAPQPSKIVSPHMNGGSPVAGSSARGVSEAASAVSEESNVRPTTRAAKGKRNSTAGAQMVNGRRKAEDPAPGKAPASKKAKASSSVASGDEMDMGSDDEKINPDGSKSKMTEEERRKNFLERNRVAALKCRQRKKQWLANLQNKVELFSQENELLTNQVSQLREEVVNLKALLLAHKDCPINQQGNLQGAFGPTQSMEPFNQQINPYGMAGPMPNQPGIPGHHPPDRRFS